MDNNEIKKIQERFWFFQFSFINKAAMNHDKK